MKTMTMNNYSEDMEVMVTIKMMGLMMIMMMMMMMMMMMNDDDYDATGDEK